MLSRGTGAPLRAHVLGNLVANPSGEEGTSEPNDWYHSVSATEWALAARSGERSLRLNPVGATADWRAAHFTVVGGAGYRLRAYVKGTGSVQAFLTIRWFSDPGGSSFISEDNLALGGTYADWTLCQGDISAPGNAQSADLMFRCPTPTTVDLYGDDFYVRRS